MLPESLALKCEAGCGFVGQTKAGVVNHIRQKHGRMGRVMRYVPSIKGSSTSRDFPCTPGSVGRS